jgi:hypothetical protein
MYAWGLKNHKQFYNTPGGRHNKRRKAQIELRTYISPKQIYFSGSGIPGGFAQRERAVRGPGFTPTLN